jgi:hypothetical protein
MIDQAHILYERFVSNKYCDMKNDWKVITFFIGVSFESLKKYEFIENLCREMIYAYFAKI